VREKDRFDVLDRFAADYKKERKKKNLFKGKATFIGADFSSIFLVIMKIIY
jgi:hypothetical protein